jgi:hypothetical protein
MQILIDTLGWIGTVMYLVAYALVSLKKVEVDSLVYQGINILAGMLVVINTYYWHAFPSVGLNAAWIGIGMITLGRKYLVRKSHTA